MPRRLAQQRITLSDLEWPFHASPAIFVVGKLLINMHIGVVKNELRKNDYDCHVERLYM